MSFPGIWWTIWWFRQQFPLALFYLLFICPITGLGYGSGSDEEDTREGERAPVSDAEASDDAETDDDELLESIRRKRLEFERKMKEREQEEKGTVVDYSAWLSWFLKVVFLVTKTATLPV